MSLDSLKNKIGNVKECEPQCCREMTQLELLEQNLDYHLDYVGRLRRAIKELKDNPYLDEKIRMFKNL